MAKLFPTQAFSWLSVRSLSFSSFKHFDAIFRSWAKMVTLWEFIWVHHKVKGYFVICRMCRCASQFFTHWNGVNEWQMLQSKRSEHWNEWEKWKWMDEKNASNHFMESRTTYFCASFRWCVCAQCKWHDNTILKLHGDYNGEYNLFLWDGSSIHFLTLSQPLLLLETCDDETVVVEAENIGFFFLKNLNIERS